MYLPKCVDTRLKEKPQEPRKSHSKMSTNNAYSKESVPVGKPEPAKGKHGVMIPGMGAVATTLIAGVEAVRQGLAKPIGSLSQMGTDILL